MNKPRELGDAFLMSLFPDCGQSYLQNHTRTFLEGRAGHPLVLNPNDEQREELAFMLREIAASLVDKRPSRMVMPGSDPGFDEVPF